MERKVCISFQLDVACGPIKRVMLPVKSALRLLAVKSEVGA